MESGKVKRAWWTFSDSKLDPRWNKTIDDTRFALGMFQLSSPSACVKGHLSANNLDEAFSFKRILLILKQSHEGMPLFWGESVSETDSHLSLAFHSLGTPFSPSYQKWPLINDYPSLWEEKQVSVQGQMCEKVFDKITYSERSLLRPGPLPT